MTTNRDHQQGALAGFGGSAADGLIAFWAALEDLVDGEVLGKVDGVLQGVVSAGGGGDVSDHLADAVDAHDAGAISYDPAGLVVINATDVQSMGSQLDAAITGKADTAHLHDNLYIRETAGGQEPLVTANDTGAVTILLTSGNNHARTLVGNTTYTLPSGLGSGYNSFRLRKIQDATGGRTTTWPGNITWASGAVPREDTAANTFEEYFFETEDGGTNWIGHHLTAKPLPISALVVDSKTVTNIPAALTEYVLGDNKFRTKVDLSGARQARLIARVSTAAGNAGAKIRAQYSTDETTWNYLDGGTGPGTNIDTVNTTFVSAWVDLVTAARNDVFLRLVTLDGDGVADPAMGQVSIQVR